MRAIALSMFVLTIALWIMVLVQSALFVATCKKALDLGRGKDLICIERR
jgi:hypothetical protein